MIFEQSGDVKWHKGEKVTRLDSGLEQHNGEMSIKVLWIKRVQKTE